MRVRGWLIGPIYGPPESPKIKRITGLAGFFGRRFLASNSVHAWGWEFACFLFLFPNSTQIPSLFRIGFLSVWSHYIFYFSLIDHKFLTAYSLRFFPTTENKWNFAGCFINFNTTQKPWPLPVYNWTKNGRYLSFKG